MKLEPIKTTPFTHEYLPSWYNLALQDLIDIGLPTRGTASVLSVSPYSDLMGRMYDLPEVYSLIVLEVAPLPMASYLYENARCLAFMTEEQRYLFLYKAGQMGFAVPPTIVLGKTTPRLTTNVSTRTIGILMPTQNDSPLMTVFMRYATKIDHSDIVFLTYNEVEGPNTVNLMNEDETSDPRNALKFIITLDAYEPSPVLCQPFPIMYMDYYADRLYSDASEQPFFDMIEEARLLQPLMPVSDISNLHRL